MLMFLLFGSNARGDYHNNSDWDILIQNGMNMDMIHLENRQALFRME